MSLDMDAHLYNVAQVGLAFLFIFAALNSSSFIVETVVNEFADEGHVDRHDGYISASIIYLFFTFASTIAAPIIGLIGPKCAMVGSACAYAIYQAGFLFLNKLFLFASSALMGIGAAILWTAQGKYMCLNSTDETAGKNSGIFWAISQACIIFGGIFMFIVFYSNESPRISRSTVTIIYAVFTLITAVGITLLAFLSIPPTVTTTTAVGGTLTSSVQVVRVVDEEEDLQSTTQLPINFDSATAENAIFCDDVNWNSLQTSVFHQQLQIMTGTIRLVSTKKMAIMVVPFAYTGLLLSFWSGIYPTCIASTLSFDYNTKCLLALNAIMQGIGQSISGFLFGILGPKTKRLGRHRILALGGLVHLLTFALIFMNLPPEAPLGQTNKMGLIGPSIPIALLCGFALGFGDACWNTQIYAHLIANYPESKNTEAFSLFRFFHSLLTSISFYYSRLVSLPFHLVILTVVGVAGMIGFYVADRRIPDTETKDKALEKEM